MFMLAVCPKKLMQVFLELVTILAVFCYNVYVNQIKREKQMNITELCSQTLAARTSKEAIEDAEFNNSPVREHFDRRIKEAAAKGKSEVSDNYYYIKERILGKKYSGPSINAAIRHYTREGFAAREYSWLSPNGYGNTALIISWQ